MPVTLEERRPSGSSPKTCLPSLVSDSVVGVDLQKPLPQFFRHFFDPGQVLLSNQGLVAGRQRLEKLGCIRTQQTVIQHLLELADVQLLARYRRQKQVSAVGIKGRIEILPAYPTQQLKLERETRIELATNSLEGCDSTTELLPPAYCGIPAGAEAPSVYASIAARLKPCPSTKHLPYRTNPYFCGPEGSKHQTADSLTAQFDASKIWS